MVLFWKIRYLDSSDRQFKNRDLYLDTSVLDADTRAAIELCYELCHSSGSRRDFLRYRHLFHDRSPEQLNELCCTHGKFGSVFIHDYVEDEHGMPLTDRQVAVTATGNPNAVLFPAGTPDYFIRWVFADKPPIAVDQITVSEDDLCSLSIFERDLSELRGSAFLKEGPGVWSGVAGHDFSLKTAVSDEEIRSFVTIFRRLYMEKERANFVKAAKVLGRAVKTHPLAKLMKGAIREYKADLDKPPSLAPPLAQHPCPFTCKQLIDVFLYTQFAHQPDAERSLEFQQCVTAVGGSEQALTWLFLMELYYCCLHIINYGGFIVHFLEGYRKLHGTPANVIASIATYNPGLGKAEKKQDREKRLFEEAAGRRADDIWRERGCPPGGSGQYLEEARCRLHARASGGG